MIEIVETYVEEVLSGRLLAGPHVRAACERHRWDMEHQDDFYFDVEAAEHVIGYFSDVLVLVGGEWEMKPFILLPWEQFIVSSLYGWKRKRDGFRRYRKGYIETGKGSGKTPMCAGLALYAITADQEQRAEGYVAARTADQALVTFRPLVAMVEASPALSERCHVSGGRDNPYNVSHYKSMSFIRRISSDKLGKGKSGPISHFNVLDEYHEHETSAMADFLEAGRKNRRQPLSFIITNAGTSKVSPCGQEHDYAVKVAAREMKNDTYFAYVCAMDEGDEPFKDETCWIKTNPSLPYTPGYEYIREEVDKAMGMPSKRAMVERLCFCIWTEAIAPWFERDVWRGVEADAAEEPLLVEYPCYGAIDLAMRKDLVGGALVWDMQDGRYYGKIKAWTPKETIVQRASDDGAPYVEWVERGHLEATSGAIINLSWVAKWISEVMGEYDLQGIAFDPWKIYLLEEELDRIGITMRRTAQTGTGLLLAGHPQGFYAGSKTDDPERVPLFMPRSIDGVEELILENRIKVLKNPVLRWGAMSTVLIEDASANRRISKTKSKARIDPMVALTMAIGFARAGLPPLAPRRGVDHYTMGQAV